ncbi:MAG: hypothetical protein JWO67_4181 [Streptosporangiaceae bacterium]|nr:hypothetical protein [Streptosporangiaceae bacterium]
MSQSARPWGAAPEPEPEPPTTGQLIASYYLELVERGVPEPVAGELAVVASQSLALVVRKPDPEPS